MGRAMDWQLVAITAGPVAAAAVLDDKPDRVVSGLRVRVLSPLGDRQAAAIRQSFAICMMNKDARSLLWSELQPELLGLVLLWLPSLVDRVRLRAVCRPWRSNAQLQPLPPPLPWLTLFDGTFLSIPDGKIIRMPMPDDAFCRGSVGSWLFFVRSDGGCSLTNPFSKATRKLPKLSIKWFNANSIYGPRFHKLWWFPRPWNHRHRPGSLAVALILDNGRTIRICQPPIATDLSIGRKLGLFSHLYGALLRCAILVW